MRRRHLIVKHLLQCRRARSVDIPAMSRIRLSVTENTLSDPAKVTRQMYQDYLHLLGRGWVCCSGRKIVGFAYASRDDASIWALFIQPGYAGLGIGRRLMGFAESWLFAIGVPAIVLETGRGTRAERFYTEAGWLPDPGADAGKRNVTFRKLAPVSRHC